MNLTVKLRNIGIIKQAEFTLGDLTIICGENNTGKTYTACALYGFLSSWRKYIEIPITQQEIHKLLKDGGKIELDQGVDWILRNAGKVYSKQLEKIFVGSEETFQDSHFSLSTDEINLPIVHSEHILGPPDQVLIYTIKFKRQGGMEVTLGVKTGQDKEFNASITKSALNLSIADSIFSHFFPRPFICSSERTGVSIFRKELDYAHDLLLKKMESADPNIDLRQLLSKSYQSYPSPIEANVDFSRRLDTITNSKSFISKEHPEVLTDLSDTIGGKYVVTQNDQLYFVPKGTQIKLTMVESSSTARSLLDLSFYLSHHAKKGDLIMVDEPELSLHPENQRRIARLLARLVNLGVKVFITTHSDYIIKELNTLIMLNHDMSHMKRIAEENGYQENELINAEQIKVYVSKKELMPLENGQKKRRRGHTLVPADIDPEYGIEVDSFDKTIDAMNKIQRDIVWGAKKDK